MLIEDRNQKCTLIFPICQAERRHRLVIMIDDDNKDIVEYNNINKINELTFSLIIQLLFVKEYTIYILNFSLFFQKNIFLSTHKRQHSPIFTNITFQIIIFQLAAPFSKFLNFCFKNISKRLFYVQQQFYKDYYCSGQLIIMI